MKHGLGLQYEKDDPFRAAARLHQSRYRVEVLGKGHGDHGNMLKDEDARALLNYYEGLGVRDVLRARYPHYSRDRDANMLRSEHIPFNCFGPLVTKPELGPGLVSFLAGKPVHAPLDIRFEWAPSPRQAYLDDRTAFDVYIAGLDTSGCPIGIGIEVKYTEQGYRVGKDEAARIADPSSPYWSVTVLSGEFERTDPGLLGSDELRQVWRNHLLGLSMRLRGDIADFVSVVLYPPGNRPIGNAIVKYRGLLKPVAREGLQGRTFDDFIDAIDGDEETVAWRRYLAARYVVECDDNRAPDE